jgi:hypothetical protein
MGAVLPHKGSTTAVALAGNPKTALPPLHPVLSLMAIAIVLECCTIADPKPVAIPVYKSTRRKKRRERH